MFQNNNNNILIILFVFCFLVLLIFVFWIFLVFYFKFKSRFWHLQPVSHLYDWHYMFYKNQIINSYLPKKNTYVDLNNIIVKPFSNSSELSKNEIKDFVELIQNHYFSNKENKFFPEKENIFPYLNNCNNKSFISFLYQDEFNKKENEIEKSKKIIGTMSTKSLNMFNSKSKQNLPVYYVDYLTIVKQYRKKNWAEKIIQTHEYIQRNTNQKIQVSLFKREGDITGITPLTIYKSYGFSMKNWRTNEKFARNKTINLIDINETNFHILREFLDVSKNLFDVFIYPDYSNILELIKTKNIFITMSIVNNTVQCLYIFKKTCTFIDKNSEFISLIASIKTDKISNAEFIDLFKLSLEKTLLSNSKIPLTHLLVEDTSNNNIIIDNLRKKTEPLCISPTAFFLYNYISPTVPSNKIFILL